MEYEFIADRLPLFSSSKQRIEESPFPPSVSLGKQFEWKFSLTFKEKTQWVPFYNSPTPLQESSQWEMIYQDHILQLCSLGPSQEKASTTKINGLSVEVDQFVFAPGNYKFTLVLKSTENLHPKLAGWTLSKPPIPLPTGPSFATCTCAVFPTALSQMEWKTPKKEHLCSPTSSLMALRAQNPSLPIEDSFWQSFWNPAHEMFGIWPQAIYSANQHDFWGSLVLQPSLELLHSYIRSTGPVPVSISFGPGELTGSPLEKTNGHFVLLAGWNSKYALVFDPAAPSSSTVFREYPLQEFWKAWTSHGGMTYFFRPINERAT